MNNTRVHRALDELARIEGDLKEWLEERIVARGTPRVLYFDLTDTWFDAGGGTLARRAQTKQGHRCKRKIHIALMVNENGLPMRWSLLPGALSETTVLPEWLDYLHSRPGLDPAILIFDRGMPCADNLSRLVGNGDLGDKGTGRLFLTSLKSDAITSCVELDQAGLDALQALHPEADAAQVAEACAALGLEHLREETYAKDLGVVRPFRATHRADLPPMRMYLSFNREIQRHKQAARQERIDRVRQFVDNLNQELREAKQPRKTEPTLRKLTRLLERLELLELFDVDHQPCHVQGRTKEIESLQLSIQLRQNTLRNARRYDGISLLVGHPKLKMTVAEAIAAYRQKNVVEADFRIIKSVLKLRPTFHWTDAKIQSHVTICTIALLVERLLEEQLLDSTLPPSSSPDSANALLHELNEVQLDRLIVNGRTYTTRTDASPGVSQALKALRLDHLLRAYPPTIQLNTNTL